MLLINPAAAASSTNAPALAATPEKPKPEAATEALYQQGLNLLKDNNPQAAVERFRKAADKNHPDAIERIALMYSQGAGVEKNQAEVLKWFQKGAELKLPLSLHWMGHFYENGHGVAKNPQKALEHYQKAADKNHPAAIERIAWMYHHGIGVEKNQTEALKWFQKGAELKLPLSLHWMGHFYENGLGVAKDPQKALEHYQKAEALGDTGAAKAAERIKQQIAAAANAPRQAPFDRAEWDKKVRALASLEMAVEIHFGISSDKGVFVKLPEHPLAEEKRLAANRKRVLDLETQVEHNQKNGNESKNVPLYEELVSLYDKSDEAEAQRFSAALLWKQNWWETQHKKNPKDFQAALNYSRGIANDDLHEEFLHELSQKHPAKAEPWLELADLQLMRIAPSLLGLSPEDEQRMETSLDQGQILMALASRAMNPVWVSQSQAQINRLAERYLRFMEAALKRDPKNKTATFGIQMALFVQTFVKDMVGASKHASMEKGAMEALLRAVPALCKLMADVPGAEKEPLSEILKLAATILASAEAQAMLHAAPVDIKAPAAETSSDPAHSLAQWVKLFARHKETLRKTQTKLGEHISSKDAQVRARAFLLRGLLSATALDYEGVAAFHNDFKKSLTVSPGIGLPLLVFGHHSIRNSPETLVWRLLLQRNEFPLFHPASADKELESIAKTWPEDPTVQMYICKFYFDSGEYQKATQCAERILKLAPNDYFFTKALVAIHLRSGAAPERIIPEIRSLVENTALKTAFKSNDDKKKAAARTSIQNALILSAITAALAKNNREVQRAIENIRYLQQDDKTESKWIDELQTLLKAGETE